MNDVKAKIAQGQMARSGLLNPEMVEKAAELATEVANSELETIRVLFADQHGILRGKTIVASAFESIFTSGIAVPSTLLLKDTAHKTVFPVWSKDPSIAGGMAGAGDILMLPDPRTFKKLPWSDHSAWIFCDPRFKSGGQIPFSPRGVLKSAIADLTNAGLKMVVGLEVEFHVYECVDGMHDHSSAAMPGEPVKTRNLAHGYQFLTETRYAELETVMDILRRQCQILGLPIRSMEVEMGPSQFEFTFEPADPLTHADNMMVFRTMVKEVCAQKGLHATFMCRPNLENAVASGWHLHQSIVDLKTGKNLMMPKENRELSKTASGWIAGLLAHAAESCLLTTPSVNGYKRYRPRELAPDRIQWGHDNRGAMVRAIMAPDDSASRVENRVAETTANPYYFFASQILTGLDGLTRGLVPPEAVETPYDADVQALPDSLLSAIQHFESSSFYREKLGDVFVDYLSRIKRAEWDRYNLTVSDWEQREYFGLY
ncbi:MAG: glutamine synthetase family protein [Paracoccaceae bacterium]